MSLPRSRRRPLKSIGMDLSTVRLPFARFALLGWLAYYPWRFVFTDQPHAPATTELTGNAEELLSSGPFELPSSLDSLPGQS
jgi:hypothetical protein